jgi:hypothetical protein
MQSSDSSGCIHDTFPVSFQMSKGQQRGSGASDTSAPVGPALGYWVKEGVGLVVHFPSEDVAKINTP